MVNRDHCGLIRIIVASTLLAGVSNIVLESRVLKPPPQVLVLSRPPALFPSLPLPPGNVSINYLKWNSTKDDWSDAGML